MFEENSDVVAAGSGIFAESHFRSRAEKLFYSQLGHTACRSVLEKHGHVPVCGSLGVQSVEGVLTLHLCGCAAPVNLLKLHVYVTVPMYVCLSTT